MLKKYIQLVVTLGLISTLSACTYSSIEVPDTVPKIIVPVTVKQEEEVTYKKVDEVQFKQFFDAYFSLSQDEILLLNQNPTTVGEAYWKLYEAKDKLLEELFGKYMSKDLTKKMNEKYVVNDFQLPKLLEINNYVTNGAARVEKVEIVSVKPLGENIIYEVAVTTKNKVMDSVTANENYVWSNGLRYYVKTNTPNKIMPTFNTVQNIEEEIKNSYMFLQETKEGVEDEIRLKHHYWIEATKEEKLQICRLTEANPIASQDEFRQKACNNKYVTRMPYWDKPPEKAAQTAKKVLLKLLEQPSDFFKYYEKALDTSKESLASIFKTDLKLEKDVSVPNDYKGAYGKSINPYKDNVMQLHIDPNKVQIEVSVYATAQQPRLEITVPTEVLLNNNNTVYYTYDYLVGLEKDKVEFIHFIKMKQITEEVYNGSDRRQ